MGPTLPGAHLPIPSHEIGSQAQLFTAFLSDLFAAFQQRLQADVFHAFNGCAQILGSIILHPATCALRLGRLRSRQEGASGIAVLYTDDGFCYLQPSMHIAILYVVALVPTARPAKPPSIEKGRYRCSGTLGSRTGCLAIIRIQTGVFGGSSIYGAVWCECSLLPGQCRRNMLLVGRSLQWWRQSSVAVH